jgi:oxygen-independent coproporphyrinogen-3 oxidase
MGYTTRVAPDMLGVGVSAIGEVGGAFAQNVKKLSAYSAALDAGRFPIERGYALDCDDRARRHVITQLMCNLRVDCRAVDRLFGLAFSDYFKCELDTLLSPGGPVDDGFLCVTPDALEVTPRGRLFVRTICMTFDRYLATHNAKPVFSRTI